MEFASKLMVSNIFDVRPIEIADYYCRNISSFKACSPVRHESFYTVKYWTDYISSLKEMNPCSSDHYAVVDGASESLIGSINYTNIIRDPFRACFLGFIANLNEFYSNSMQLL